MKNKEDNRERYNIYKNKQNISNFKIKNKTKKIV